jgi:hypothetical protein
VTYLERFEGGGGRGEILVFVSYVLYCNIFGSVVLCCAVSYYPLLHSAPKYSHVLCMSGCSTRAQVSCVYQLRPLPTGVKNEFIFMSFFITAFFDRSEKFSSAYMVHCCYTVVTLLLYCCYTVVILMLHCCYTFVILLLYCCYTVVILLLYCCYTVSTLLLYCCHTDVTLLSQCCHTVVTPVLPLSPPCWLTVPLSTCACVCDCPSHICVCMSVCARV